MRLDGYIAYELIEEKLVDCLAHIRGCEENTSKIEAGKVDVVLNFIGKFHGLEQKIKGKSIKDKFNTR